MIIIIIVFSATLSPPMVRQLGDRNTVDTNLRLRGAETSPYVNKNVDYLEIGTLASRDWLYTAHGRKIEKAMLLKRKGVDITCITERNLLRFLG